MSEVNLTKKQKLSSNKGDLSFIQDKSGFKATELTSKQKRDQFKLNNVALGKVSNKNRSTLNSNLKTSLDSNKSFETKTKTTTASLKAYTLPTERSPIEKKVITKLMRKGKREKAEITLLKALKKVEQELLKKELIKVSGTKVLDKDFMALNSIKGKVNSHEIEDSDLQKLNKKQKPLSVKVSDKNKPITQEQLNTTEVKGELKGSLRKSNNTDKVNINQLLEKIIDNAKPLVRLKKVRIAGTTHQKPVALTKKQAESDAIKRIITNAKARSEKSATLKLAKEFEEIYLNTMSNKTLTEVRDLHKLAEANKANITLK